MKKKPAKNNYKNVTNFFFEAGTFGRTPRSWTYFAGCSPRNVGEHTSRVAHIGYGLAKLHGEADVSKIVLMCLFHDFAEARTSDHNYVHQKYSSANEEGAIQDFTKELPFGGEIRAILAEYKQRKTIESQLAKDADCLEWLLTIKEESDAGNKIIDDMWFSTGYKRIKTPLAIEIADEILKTRCDDWWAGNRDDEWWITRNKKKENG